MNDNFLKNVLILTLIISFGLFTISCNNKADTSEKNLQTEITDTLASVYFKEIVKTHSSGKPAKVQYFDTSSNNKVLKHEIRYYQNGKKEMEGAYKNGKRHGKWIAWYDNEVVWSIGYYKQGLKHGKSEVYFPNGEVRYEKNYVNDTADGTWLFFDENGNPIGKVVYQKGEIIEEVGI
ncbi:MAG TPA: hypothetical protein PLO05_02370 [Bacteroidales bacterium]|nr:hypothetical protein [Bacteroidales bacterium]MDD4235407.1 hypothetical protein [Bacteroidales bacterium]HXK80987.1 hypothetical protein [Bacteroidales bacterium]